MSGLFDLPPEQRAARFLALAGDARREAVMSKGAVRQSYILIAEQWERLAVEASSAIPNKNA
jgi:hypothetical protein